MLMDMKHGLLPTSAIFHHPFLWPLLAGLLVGLAITDYMVECEKRRTFRTLGRGDVLVIVVGGAAGIVSLVWHLTVPASRSLGWPIGFMTAAELAVPLRAWSISLLRGDFNSDLKVRKGVQLVVTTGPYGVVRHPGYVGTIVLWLLLPGVSGLWPVLLVAAVGSAVYWPRRILKEEAINREGIVGYAEYMDRVRWRLIPFIW
jgi:protein-S-isoprenylcysteine O-methyltransferase Ste14